MQNVRRAFLSRLQADINVCDLFRKRMIEGNIKIINFIMWAAWSHTS